MKYSNDISNKKNMVNAMKYKKSIKEQEDELNKNQTVIK